MRETSIMHCAIMATRPRIQPTSSWSETDIVRSTLCLCIDYRYRRTRNTAPCTCIVSVSTTNGKQDCRAIAGRTAWCRCKFRYVSKFSVASRGFHCDNNAFELNNGTNHGKNNGVKYIYLLPLNSLFDSHCLRYNFTVGLIVLLKIRHFWAHLALT